MHPDSRSPSVQRCGVKVSRTDTLDFLIEYVIVGNIANLLVPVADAGERRDRLWRHTCFEFFATMGEGMYVEFNFSPSTSWAAYTFASYRQRTISTFGKQPRIEVLTSFERLTVSVALSLSAFMPSPPELVGLSAVIEEKSGQKSYWALAHPPGPPDFHHRDCFALEVGAAGAA
jgi:hypothetical protein